MAADDEPVNITLGSANLLGRVVKEFRGRGRGEVPLPKRRRNPDGSGGGGSVSGGLYLPTDTISGPTLLTVADLPADVATAVPVGTDTGAKCWLLGSGPATPYKLAAARDEMDALTGIYAIPAVSAEGGDTIYNMLGTVVIDLLVQTKDFTVTMGGSTFTISIIDAQACS